MYIIIYIYIYIYAWNKYLSPKLMQNTMYNNGMITKLKEKILLGALKWMLLKS